MSNDSRENLHGIKDQEPADLTFAAGPADAQPASAAGAGASAVEASPAEGALAPFPSRAPAAEPRPWYRSRRSFAAKGRGGRVQVAGLGVTYTDHESGAVLLAGIDLGFRARTLSTILDPTGRRARALFLILAGLEEPQAGRVVAAPSRSLSARLAGRIGSVALIRADSPLDESLTIRQNILAPLSATGSVADWDNLVGALQITGLAQRVDLRPSQLSPWEHIKALIARAIVSGAEVFLVEDPTSLPEADRPGFERLLRGLASAGCAVVLSTPDPQVAAAGDRAILLTNGHVALDAPGPSIELISTSLEANPEDPQVLRALAAASADEAADARAQSASPSRTDAEAPLRGFDPEAAEDVPVADTEASGTVSVDEPRTETAMRGIPIVEAEDPTLAEPEVSELVVRARKILSDLPGSIAPRE